MRIISLVPSLTELLYDLGLQESVIGRTRFCIHPADKVKKAEKLGGTKNPNIPRIGKMKPDLVIASREENRKEDIRKIEQLTAARMMVTDIKTIDQALEAIAEIGEITGKSTEAGELVQKIQAARPEPGIYTPLPAAYLIWNKPMMSVGGDTYIHDVMREFGLENVFGHRRRYPETSLKELSGETVEGVPSHDRITSPKYLLLSSEPFPFKDEHAQEFNAELENSDTQSLLVDGEHFSWYGSRMAGAFKALQSWRKALE